jgi:hypothetical protein
MKGQLKVISNRGWFKKENERYFLWRKVATTIIALDLFNDVTKTESIKSNSSWLLFGFRQQSSETNYV